MPSYGEISRVRSMGHRSARTIQVKVVPAVIGGALALVLASTGGAVADLLITGADVKDGSLTGRDIRAGSVRAGDLNDDVRDPLQRIGHFKRYTTRSAFVPAGGSGYVSFTCPAANGVRAIGAGAEWEGVGGEHNSLQVAPNEGTDNGWHAVGFNSIDTDRIVLSVTCGRVAYYSSDQ